MKPEQELAILFFALFVGFVAIIIMLSVVLSRMSKQKQNSRSIKHSTFYSILPNLIGGQILIRSRVLFEETGIIDDIKLNTRNDWIDLDFSCSWTAERKNDNSKWMPRIVGCDKKYYNFFKEGTLFEIDKASIFKIGNDGFCIVMENAQGVVFLYPKSEHIIKLEDVDDYEAMFTPILAKV